MKSTRWKCDNCDGNCTIEINGIVDVCENCDGIGYSDRGNYWQEKLREEPYRSYIFEICSRQLGFGVRVIKKQPFIDTTTIALTQERAIAKAKSYVDHELEGVEYDDIPF